MISDLSRVRIRLLVGAGQRAAAPAWMGVGLFAAIAMGGNGLAPSTAVAAMQASPVLSSILTGLWTALIAPAASGLRRARGLAYLRALPGGVGEGMVIALVTAGMQIPWLALWLGGGGWSREWWSALVAAVVPWAVTLGVAWMPPWGRQRLAPRWSSLWRALSAVSCRGMVRLRGEWLVRSPALAVVGGILPGVLVARNPMNTMETVTVASAAALPALAAAWMTPMMSLCDEQRRFAPWAAALAVTREQRLLATWLAALPVALLMAGAVGCGMLLGVSLSRAPEVIPSPTVSTMLAAAAGIGVVSLSAALVACGASLRCSNNNRPVGAASASSLILFVVMCLLLFAVAGALGLAFIACFALAFALQSAHLLRGYP